jgi:hypothetical protein
LSGIALVTRWHGLPDLETRSVAIGAGWRAARLALGVSQTGAADLGWSALAVGVGAAGATSGAALRGCVRTRPGLASAEPAFGGEVGAGAWIAPTKDVVVWTSAPQLWTRGDPPPLARWLEIGARAHIADARVWLARAAAPGAPDGLRGEHVGGLALPLGAAALWIEGRDHPARASVGLEASVGPLRAAMAVDGHPVLGETVRLALVMREPAWW